MRKLLFGLIALFFTLPAIATPDHWTCSNNQTVLYMVLNTAENVFMLWDDKGEFLAAGSFTMLATTENGKKFAAAILENGVGIGVSKGEQPNTLILAISKDAENKTSDNLICN